MDENSLQVPPGVSRTGRPRACHGPSHLSLVWPRTFRVGQVADRSLDGRWTEPGIPWDPVTRPRHAATAEASCSSCVFPCGRTGGILWCANANKRIYIYIYHSILWRACRKIWCYLDANLVNTRNPGTRFGCVWFVSSSFSRCSPSESALFDSTRSWFDWKTWFKLVAARKKCHHTMMINYMCIHMLTHTISFDKTGVGNDLHSISEVSKWCHASPCRWIPQRETVAREWLGPQSLWISCQNSGANGRLSGGFECWWLGGWVVGWLLTLLTLLTCSPKKNTNGVLPSCPAAQGVADHEPGRIARSQLSRSQSLRQSLGENRFTGRIWWS